MGQTPFQPALRSPRLQRITATVASTGGERSQIAAMLTRTTDAKRKGMKVMYTDDIRSENLVQGRCIMRERPRKYLVEQSRTVGRQKEARKSY